MLFRTRISPQCSGGLASLAPDDTVPLMCGFDSPQVTNPVAVSQYGPSCWTGHKTLTLFTTCRYEVVYTVEQEV